jgi:hypothetical protein
MFDRENAIGFLLLGLCIVAGGVMVFAITTDTELSYSGPTWLSVVLVVTFVGAILYGLLARRVGGRRFGEPPHWPNINSGLRGRSWWRRLFDRYTRR